MCREAQRATLTQQLVRPAVERLAGRGVLVLLVVLDGPEVSQGSHEAPEVHLVLPKKQEGRGDKMSPWTPDSQKK